MPFTRRLTASEPNLAVALASDPNAPSAIPPQVPQLPGIAVPSEHHRQSHVPSSDLDPVQSAAPRLSLAIALRHRAIAAAQQGYYITALTFFRQLLRYGAEAQDYNHRGCVYIKLDQPIEAIADFDRAIQLAPAPHPFAPNPSFNLAEIYLNRGNAILMIGDYDAALHNYSEALLLNPQNARAWINRGIALRNLQLYPLAIQSFDQALRLGSMDGQIYSERGRTYELSGDWNCACADYRRSIDCLQGSKTDGNHLLLDQVQSWLAALIGQA